MNRAIIITGDRNATLEQWGAAIGRVINPMALHRSSRLFVIHGDARGIDSIAENICTDFRFVQTIPMPAQWNTHGKAAGPRRNEQMLNVLLALRKAGYEIAVHAFHDSITTSKGTGHMVRISQEAGVLVIVHTSDTDPPRRERQEGE